MEWRDSAEAVEAPKSIEANRSKTATVSTPPREEPVTRSGWQPAEAAPSAPSHTYVPTTPETKERHISRRPEWTIKPTAIHRSWPPSPRAAVHHPAPVVIWRPAPRLVANPSPAVVRLPYPVTVAIRNPAFGLIRNPDVSVVRFVFPTPIGVQVFRAGVIAIGVIPRLRGVNHVVAVAVPAIPIVPVRSFRDFVLCLLSASTHRCHLALLHFGNALRCGNLSLTLAHDNNSVAIGPHFYSDNDILVSRMNSDIWRID